MSILKITLLITLLVGVGYVIFLKLFVRLSKHIQILNVDEFENHLKITKDAQLIDVRTPREFEKHHIAGAKNIDFLNSGFRREIKKLDKSKPIMVYCHSGYRSKMVLPIFCSEGFSTIYELDTGFSAWQKSEKEVKRCCKNK